jgi:hypothetical protein
MRQKGSFAWFALVAGGVFGLAAHSTVAAMSPVTQTEMTLALKFVEFTDAKQGGRPVLTRPEAEKVVAGMNAVYAQCGMRLKLEEYTEVDPGKFGLARKLSSPDEMDSVRTPFDSDRYLVVIHTGAWDRKPKGAMGKVNAWTAMPGQLPAGAVLEAPVADNGNITAHELGHYLGLDHARDEDELMNPIIYKKSVRITPSQCARMRATAAASRAGAIRST